MSGGFWVAVSLVHHGLGDSWVPRSWFPQYKLHQFVAFWHTQIPHWSWGNKKGEKKNPIGFFFWSCNLNCSGNMKSLKPSWDRVMFCAWFEDRELGHPIAFLPPLGTWLWHKSGIQWATGEATVHDYLNWAGCLHLFFHLRTVCSPQLQQSRLVVKNKPLWSLFLSLIPTNI